VLPHGVSESAGLVAAVATDARTLFGNGSVGMLVDIFSASRDRFRPLGCGEIAGWSCWSAEDPPGSPHSDRLRWRFLGADLSRWEAISISSCR